MMLGPHSSDGSARAVMPWPKAWTVSGAEIGGEIETSACVFKDILHGDRRMWSFSWEGISEANRNTLRAEYVRTTNLDLTAPDQGSSGWYEVVPVTNSWQETPVRDRVLAQGYFRYDINFGMKET